MVAHVTVAPYYRLVSHSDLLEKLPCSFWFCSLSQSQKRIQMGNIKGRTFFFLLNPLLYQKPQWRLCPIAFESTHCFRSKKQNEKLAQKFFPPPKNAAFLWHFFIFYSSPRFSCVFYKHFFGWHFFSLYTFLTCIFLPFFISYGEAYGKLPEKLRHTLSMLHF